MEYVKVEFEVRLMLSLQRALLGVVVPGLRAVLAGHTKDYILIKYVFDHMPCEEEKDILSETGVLVQSDFNTSKIEEFEYSENRCSDLKNKNYKFIAFLRFEKVWRL